MIIIDGYSIQQYPKQNKIVIGLPQTMRTCTTTAGEIEDRKDELGSTEQTIILSIIKGMYEGLYDEVTEEQA